MTYGRASAKNVLINLRKKILRMADIKRCAKKGCPHCKKALRTLKE